eukprot:TRINITY_DN27539_c0_g1_i1.p1 TRINITY_DN27539_c0_g1~~TRINITY_DN27539_c0_g1_i1.p1  ORF type:complete len:252 (+),score=50.20 TRINITY_DN27539_c0_g1_i1:57-812(+)
MTFEPTTPPAQVNTPLVVVTDSLTPAASTQGPSSMKGTPSPSRSNRVYNEAKVRCQQDQWDSPRWRNRVEPRVVEHPYRDESSPREKNVPREGAPHFSLEALQHAKKYHTSETRTLASAVNRETTKPATTSPSPDGSGTILQRSLKVLNEEKKHHRNSVASSPRFKKGIEPEKVSHPYEFEDTPQAFSQKALCRMKRYHAGEISCSVARQERELQKKVMKPDIQAKSHKLFAQKKTRCQTAINVPQKTVTI